MTTDFESHVTQNLRDAAPETELPPIGQIHRTAQAIHRRGRVQTAVAGIAVLIVLVTSATLIFASQESPESEVATSSPDNTPDPSTPTVEPTEPSISPADHLRGLVFTTEGGLTPGVLSASDINSSPLQVTVSPDAEMLIEDLRTFGPEILNLTVGLRSLPLQGNAVDVCPMIPDGETHPHLRVAERLLVNLAPGAGIALPVAFETAGQPLDRAITRSEAFLTDDEGRIKGISIVEINDAGIALTSAEGDATTTVLFQIGAVACAAGDPYTTPAGSYNLVLVLSLADPTSRPIGLSAVTYIFEAGTITVT